MRGLVSCDWLALSCELARPDPRPSVPDGWRLEALSGTAVWGVREFLFDERGAKVATYLRSPKSSIMDARRMVIEVANEWLYNYLIDSVLEKILDVYSCRVTGMPRFDLCLDAELDEQAVEVMLGLAVGDIYKTSTQQGVVWWSQKSGRRVPHQISWGAPESTLHWKLYNKYKELHKNGVCSKPYIVDEWRALGMKVTRVWRLEVSVSDSPKLKVKDCDVERKLTWQDVLFRKMPLFLDLYENRFVLRRNEGHSNKTRDQRVWLWGLERMQVLVSYDNAHGGNVTDSDRRLLRKLFTEYQKVDRSNLTVAVLESSIGVLLQKPDLMGMMEQMSGWSRREIHMRFPLSSDVPADRRNWRQTEIPFAADVPYPTVVYNNSARPCQLLAGEYVMYPDGCGPYVDKVTYPKFPPRVAYPDGCGPNVDLATYRQHVLPLSVVGC